jgi:hypothetical protein
VDIQQSLFDEPASTAQTIEVVRLRQVLQDIHAVLANAIAFIDNECEDADEGEPGSCSSDLIWECAIRSAIQIIKGVQDV